MCETLCVVDQGERLSFSYADMLRYHGPGSPGGVAHAFKVLQRALPLLGPAAPPERRELVIQTSFGGPGARDAFEFVTRAVTEGRYSVEASLRLPERGLALERFVFRLRYREREVTLLARPGYVTDEFILLARNKTRTAEQDQRLAAMKLDMATRVMAAPAEAVYDATEIR